MPIWWVVCNFSYIYSLWILWRGMWLLHALVFHMAKPELCFITSFYWTVMEDLLNAASVFWKAWENIREAFRIIRQISSSDLWETSTQHLIFEETKKKVNSCLTLCSQGRKWIVHTHWWSWKNVFLICRRISGNKTADEFICWLKTPTTLIVGIF